MADETPTRCDLVVIGGTGWGRWKDLEQPLPVSIPTPFAQAPVTLQIGRLGAAAVGFLARHGGGHTIPPHRVDYRANVWAVARLQPALVLAINAVGSLNRAMPPAALVLPDQLIDYTWGRKHSFVDALEVPMHVDFGEPFDPAARDRIRAADRSGALVADRAVYGVTQGPRLETRAEVEKLGRDGCDLVGMTAMPEAGLARELGLAYASVCIVANWAAGINGDEPLTMTEITANIDAARSALQGLIANLAADLT